MPQLANPTLNQSLINAAANELAQRRATGNAGERLAPALRPHNVAQAFAIQQAVAHLYQKANNPIAGWKCLLPSADKIVVAPIYQQDMYRHPSNCPLYPSAAGSARVEPELAFEIAEDLPPNSQAYSQAQIDSALGHTHLALELINSRYQNPSEANYFDALADGLVNQGLWLGPCIDTDNLEAEKIDTHQFELSVKVENGEHRQILATHPNGLAKAGLYWLVNFLSAQGIGLKRGQYVITGSYAGVLELPLAQRCQFQYGSLGGFEVEFVDKSSSR